MSHLILSRSHKSTAHSSSLSFPLSSNSSPNPPFSFPFFASFALCTAPFLRASSGPRSFSRSATARFFSGSTRLRFAIWRSRSASSCSFLESSESVGCSGRLSDGFEDFGCCDARRVATVSSRFSISSGSAASCAVWSSTSSYPVIDCQRVRVLSQIVRYTYVSQGLFLAPPDHQ